jgi:hypothetical protein
MARGRRGAPGMAGKKAVVRGKNFLKTILPQKNFINLLIFAGNTAGGS